MQQLYAEPPNTPICDEQQAGIWGHAGVLYDSVLNRVFTATGNGNFTGTVRYFFHPSPLKEFDLTLK